jgi:uncharacterized membrane protein (UPF0127 family)
MSDVIHIGGHEFQTLVAVTPEEQERGLMFQKWPPPVMTFPYYKSAIRKFWMKNTLSPLDIVFCNNNRVVSICYGEPMSTRQIGPDIPVDLVIELPHGTVGKCGICVGDEVKTKYSQNTIAKDIGNVFRRILG